MFGAQPLENYPQYKGVGGSYVLTEIFCTNKTARIETERVLLLCNNSTNYTLTFFLFEILKRFFLNFSLFKIQRRQRRQNKEEELYSFFFLTLI